MAPKAAPTPPVEFQHRFRIRRRLTNLQWSDFLCAVPFVWTKALEGDLGPAPNPKFRAAPQEAFTLSVDAGAVVVAGRGVFRPRGSKRSMALCGIGPWATLTVPAEQASWYTAMVCTGGRPYDNAVRLVLQLLHAVAPDRVEIVSTGAEELWAATALLAADILDLPEGEVQPPMVVRRRLPADVLAVDVEPIGGTGLWRARWRQCEILPVGEGAVVRDGGAGFASEAAAREAARSFAIRHDPATALACFAP